MRGMWDVFCRVIDNHGDLGVCLRLSRQLVARGQSVRLWVDDASALSWMAPDLAAGHLPGLEWLNWSCASDPALLDSLPPASVWIEAFGCELPQAFISHGVTRVQATRQAPPIWINLEYLSAEPFVERAHGLPSPVMSGPAQGWTKRFFFPGFTERTGGLLRESELSQQQMVFDRQRHRDRWLAGQTGQRLISLFCYEPAGLTELLARWRDGDHLLLTPGRARAAVQNARKGLAQDTVPEPRLHHLPHTDQTGFDHLLWASDLNLVRGEDSLVRALWAGQAMVWHIYPQHDNAHHAKLEAFLDWLDAPITLRRFHRVWNGLQTGPLPDWDPHTLQAWSECLRSARQRLMTQTDLASRLLAATERR